MPGAKGSPRPPASPPPRGHELEQAVVYERISGPGQDFDSQHTANVQYIRRRGFVYDEISDTYRERVSGTRWDRAGFWDLLKRLDTGTVHVLVAWDLYRAGSNDMDAAILLMKCQEHGVRIELSMKGGSYILDNPHSKLHYRVDAALADFRREDLILTMNRGKDENRPRGNWTQGTPPFGYSIGGDKGDRRLVPNDDAVVVRELFARYAAGESARALVAWLQQRGPLLTSKKRVRKWDPVTVGMYVLENPAYIGQLRSAGELVPGLHEALVPRDLWDRVQDRRRRMAKHYQGRPPRPPEERAARKKAPRCSIHGTTHMTTSSGGLPMCEACGLVNTFLARRQA